MALTVAEATAVNRLVEHVLGKHAPGQPVPSAEQAQEAAALLAEHANRTLMAGLAARDVEAAAWPAIEARSATNPHGELDG